MGQNDSQYESNPRFDVPISQPMVLLKKKHQESGQGRTFVTKFLFRLRVYTPEKTMYSITFITLIYVARIKVNECTVQVFSQLFIWLVYEKYWFINIYSLIVLRRLLDLSETVDINVPDSRFLMKMSIFTLFFQFTDYHNVLYVLYILILRFTLLILE